MEERIRFAVLAAKGTEVFSDLCAEFGISRKTGYKWLRRYRQFGVAGTRELCRAELRSYFGPDCRRREIGCWPRSDPERFPAGL
jgi:transposase-like protein